MGLVKSLALPGSNVTGISLLMPELNGKRLQLLAELLSSSSRICVLDNSGCEDVLTVSLDSRVITTV